MGNTGLQLADICDLEKLYKMIEDWSNATGMSAILTDNQGKETMKSWGRSLFCRMLLNTSNGYEACCRCMDKLESGTQICYAGAYHFVVPLNFPDGTFVGKVVAGHTMLEEISDEMIIENLKSLGINEEKIRKTIAASKKRKKENADSAYTLLDSMLKSFIEKSYYIWKAGMDIRRANEERNFALEIVERQRKQIHDEIEQTLDVADMGMWTLAFTNGKEPRLFADKTMNRLLGTTEQISAEERYRRWIAGIPPEEQEAADAYMEQIRSVGRAEITYKWIHPVNGAMYVRCGGIRDDSYENGMKVRGYHQDVTVQQQADQLHKEKLQKAYEEAKRANAAKTEFLSRMSHDIRTPMNGILGMTRIAETCIDDKERVRDALNKISQSGKQLEMLINDVLDMSRLESGKTELTREKFNIVKVLDNNFTPIHLMAVEKQVTFKGPHANLTHRNVIGSPLHLQRILLNILTNAVKYNKVGGTIEAWLDETPIDENHSYYSLTIADTGIGMDEEYLKHIFEPFSREHTDAGTNYQGTGLGMAITKEIVDLMGGTIEVQSEENVGSTFCVKVPFELCMEEKAVTVSQAEQRVDLSGINILMAEDNELNIEIAKFILEEAGAEVMVARNGKEAVKLWQHMPENSFDVILMDIMMPEMDGLQATEVIRQDSRADAKTVPVIAMTANAFVEDVRRCQAAGMNDHLAKPLDIQKVYQTIVKYRKK